ncbi:hypothetical protein RDI58_022074 [Solanum bulbocastanum]|uniref:Protein kinase domain-containing protein n=1 Tax=Solanum bulbocastanum TaxID=147425 RepID=A0AAN8Y4W7_SOLBU
MYTSPIAMIHPNLWMCKIVLFYRVINNWHYMILHVNIGIQNLKVDVYIFGILLAELIGNIYIIIEKKMAIHHWILKELEGEKISKVNKSILQDNDEPANGITNLAVKCLNEDPNERPNMKEVVANLFNLVGAT